MELNRADARKAIRQMKKDEAWLNTLSPDKLRIIKQLEKTSINKVIGLMQTAVGGAIIAVMEDRVTLEDIDKIITTHIDFFGQNWDFYLQYGEKWKEVLEGMEKQIIDMMVSLLEQGKGQKEVIEAVKKEFKSVKSSSLNLAYKTAKEKWCKTVKADVKPVKEEPVKEKQGKEKPSKKIPIMGVMREEPKIEEVEVIEEVKEVPQLEETFEIIEKVIKFKGKYSEYEIKNNVLRAGELTFASLEEIENYKHNQFLELERMTEELNKAFGMV